MTEETPKRRRGRPRKNPSATEDLVGFVYDQVTTDLIITPRYEANFIDAWLTFLKDNNVTFDTFIDGGAHIGMTSRAVSPYFKKIIAFEPMDLTFELLRLNTRNTENIEIRKAALFNVTSNRKISFGKGYVSGASLEPVGETHVSQMVSTTTLDEELKGERFKNLVVKLDVEGSEFNALQGAERTIAKHKPVFIIEILRRKINDGSSDSFKFLKERGYKFYNPEIKYRGRNRIKKLFSKNSQIVIRNVENLEKVSGLYNYLICLPT